MPKKKILIEKHDLIPKHAKLGEKEKKDLLEEYKITILELPKIQKNDPSLQKLDVKPGDVVKIIRPSQTAGESMYYRCVTNV